MRNLKIFGKSFRKLLLMIERKLMKLFGCVTSKKSMKSIIWKIFIKAMLAPSDMIIVRKDILLSAILETSLALDLFGSVAGS